MNEEELSFEVRIDPHLGQIVFDFPVEVKQVNLSPQEAILLANILREKAQAFLKHKIITESWKRVVEDE